MLSKGEVKVGKVLRKLGYKFVREKTFKKLINPYTGCNLRFDFYIPSIKVCIEYDGIQHFSYVKALHGPDVKLGLWKVKNQQKKDRIKDRYCKRRNMKLIRIKYNQFDMIEKILRKEL